MRKTLERIAGFKMEKGWMWLLYLDIVLPLCLFLLSYLLNGTGIGRMFARFFHAYNLYVISPVPDPASLTGLLGLVLHIGIILYALKRKDRMDALLCAGISVLVFLFFFYEINYRFIYLLKFT